MIFTRLRFLPERNAASRFCAPTSSGNNSTFPPASKAGYKLVTVPRLLLDNPAPANQNLNSLAGSGG